MKIAGLVLTMDGLAYTISASEWFSKDAPIDDAQRDSVSGVIQRDDPLEGDDADHDTTTTTTTTAQMSDAAASTDVPASAGQACSDIEADEAQ